MSITVIAVGNIKESYYKEAIAEYAKRISGYAVFSIKEIKEEKFDEESGSGEIAKALEREGKAITEAIKSVKMPYVIALCIEGKGCSSERFGELMENIAESGRNAVFVIGSSHGLSDEVKELADRKFSFSEMTFPHRLMRVILCEQIYRGLSYTHGGKYHK